jgi:hypothetical protein
MGGNGLAITHDEKYNYKLPPFSRHTLRGDDRSDNPRPALT